MEEVDYVIKSLDEVVRRLRAMSPLYDVTFDIYPDQ